MSSIDTMFTRALLREGHKTVKKHLRKDAWVWNFNRDHWEFHGPDDFYWNGSAGDAYDARYKGWMAYLRSKGVLEEIPDD